MISNKLRVGIIDLKINNIFSIFKATQEANFGCKIISKKENYKKYDLIILPGVGSFREAMKKIKKENIDKKIYDFVEDNSKKLFGICLGMQLLFEGSAEFGNTKGLNLLSGTVEKFKKKEVKIIPHMNWNKIYLKNFNNTSVFRTFDKKDFYFVHSFYCKIKNKKNLLSYTKHENFKFCSSVQHKNILGTQFHPEKSGKIGINFLKKIEKFYEK
ncbi:imidazole glycerol phosphate synthase subunit HisH [Candidatus Pelagibacter sp.]|nr:imidazole glycerol phosphate synthase subunit HisH [Candidatus Pelagibacter sp.]